MGNNFQQKPVKVGDELNLDCNGVGRLGDGVFHYQGLVIMAPKAVPGKTYRVRIKTILVRMALAEIME